MSIARNAQIRRQLAGFRKCLIRQDKGNSRLAEVKRKLRRTSGEQRLTKQGTIAMFVESDIMAFPEEIHHANA